MSPTPAERIVTPDAERLYIDRAGLAHRVEDLEPDLQREIEKALARAHEILPRQEALAEASRLLHSHLRGVPPDDQIEIVLIAARAIDEATWTRWTLERLERRVANLEAEVTRLRRIEALRQVPERFPERCPICGLVPAPGDAHRLTRWPSGLPVLRCPTGMRGRRVGPFEADVSRWVGPVGALRLPTEIAITVVPGEQP